MKTGLQELLHTVLDHGEFPEEVKRQAEWVIADTVAAALYGLKSEKEIIRYLREKASLREEGDRRFPILGTDLVADRKDNLIIHGTAIVSNELDEGNTSAKGHPSAHILPTLLVSAFEQDAAIDRVIDAYIRAYEISARLAYASSMKDELHPHGTWGNVGGAVARALIEGKDKEAIMETVLISLSLPLSTAWMAAEKGQSVRNLYTGIGSFLAYESVSLQEYGFRSNPAVVENLWATIMGNGVDESRLTEGLMDPPLIIRNYFKVHPTCRFTHAAIDAAHELAATGTFGAGDIRTVRVETYSLAARCDTNRPQTKLQSKFSIPYAVACALMDVNLYGDYQENLSKVAGLADRIEVVESEELTKRLPAERAARVFIILNDGSVLERTIDNAQGEFTHRFSESQMWEKYENMLGGHYPDRFVDVLRAHLLDMRRCGTFKEWLQINQLMGGAVCQK